VREMELEERERLTTTALVTCCRASSRKSASAVCWEEPLSAMMVDGVWSRGKVDVKWEVRLGRSKVKMKEEKGRSKAKRKRVDEW
jgi:hypothetical protein